MSSDARIKTDLAPTDSAADLATLSRIEVTNYRHKDQSAAGATTQKKVVAQQVEQVFPQAVASRTGVVPDIYRHAEANAGWVQLATDLSVGDRVRVITPEGDSIHPVLEANPAAFRLDLPASATDVFIYGREVPDLKSVDYDALSMLNVSATQELHRKVTTLETELAARDARLKALEQRLAALEQLLAGSR
ncbi:MAG: tail fiber domain-containing protein [Verrucomicrobiota bacterium]